MMAGVEESGVDTLEEVVAVMMGVVDAVPTFDEMIVECVLPLEVVAAMTGVLDAVTTFDNDVIVECVVPFLWDSTMENGSTWVSGDLF